MAYINDKNLPYLVEKLSNADNIKINNNKHGSRVSTVINSLVTKSDNITKAIEQEVINDNYSFKVGTGDVDVSTDVEDGFGEVGVKGVTYQNLFINCNNSNCFNNYIHWSVVAENTFEVVADGTNKYLFIKKANMLLKPSTQYTFIFEVLENTLVSSDEGSYVFTIFGSSGSIVGGVALTGSNVKTTVFLKTTVSDLDTAVHGFDSYLNNRAISGKLKVRLTMLEGDHTNNPNLPSYFEGIVGVGDKSKNLFDSGLKLGNISWETGVENNLQQHVMSAEYIKVRPNTKYIIHSNTSHKLNLYFYDNSKVISAPSLEDVTISFTTNSTTEYIKVLSVNNTDLSNSRFQLEEGDVATSYEPYHDGYKIEILSNGDNIYDYTKITDNTYINTSGDIVNYTGWFSTDYIRVNKNKKYYFYNQKHRVPFAGLYCYYYDINKNKIEYLNLGDTEFVGLTEFVSKHDGYIRLSGLSHSKQVGRMYASYDKTQILLDEPLMRLPNGVCDEITRDGKLIRRVGKVVLDGSEGWYNATAADGISKYFTANDVINDIKRVIDENNQLNSHFVVRNPYQYPSESCMWALWQNSSRIRISIKNISDLSEIKNWLSQNPTTVYYELETPIITELPAPYLRIFKDGHLTFNTLVAPESNHVVQLNKSAQIERSIREVQSLDGRVGQLESFYDDMMLETSYKLNLLNYDFEYTKEREDE